MTGNANLAASVAGRLLNRAKQTGDDHQALLTSFCLERFLYRLGASELRERFVLKGAMLLRVWWTDRTARHGISISCAAATGTPIAFAPTFGGSSRPRSPPMR